MYTELMRSLQSIREFGLTGRRIIMARKKRVLSRRVWLCPNDPDTFSYVAYSRCEYDDRNTMNLKIADCNRGINLFLDGKKGMRKLDKLIKILEDARDEHQRGIDDEG